MERMADSYAFKSPIGVLRLWEEEERITGLNLERPGEETQNPHGFTAHSELLYEAYRQLTEYFAGGRRDFDLPLRCDGTAFQQRVWKELTRIPYGETRSYQDIAAGIGNPKAVRAVGQANNRNPVMIIVPCHRVIHKNGDITGFGCGTEVKRYLLELEGGRI